MGDSKYVLAKAYAAVQYWNGDKSDLVEIRREAGQDVVEIPGDIPAKEAERLVGLGAIVEPGKGSSSGSLVEEPAGNASRGDWAAYADQLGLTVEAGSSRDDIKQLVADSRA